MIDIDAVIQAYTWKYVGVNELPTIRRAVNICVVRGRVSVRLEYIEIQFILL